MKKRILIIFMIVFVLCYPQNIYADETINIENFERFNNFYAAIIGYADEIQFPQTITMYSTDGCAYTENIIWDESNIDWQKEGYYVIKGSISHVEKYNNTPQLSIGLSLYEKYDMLLQTDTITHNSVTFSFQDSYNFKEHELDVSRLHVWACKAKQYIQEHNWYDVTDYSNVHLTPTGLTIDGLESMYELDDTYRIQISYDDPLYLKYSSITNIIFFEDVLFVSILAGGDRNGGNREKEMKLLFLKKMIIQKIIKKV